MAQLIFDDPNTATDQARLVLTGVSPATTWFTDKPIRRAGAFETEYFSSSETFDENGVWLGAPNAALTGTHDGQPYVVIVTLFSPTYNNQTHTLQYHASLMINETDKNMRLAGGAVHFQANHAVDELGALRYVSTGQDAFTLHNAALFIDDYLGAYPNGICLSSFVSCPSYFGFYRRGWWGGGYGPGFSNYIGIRRLCPKCWERRADDSPDEVPPPKQTPSPSPPPSKDWNKDKWSPSPKQDWNKDKWSPSPKQDWNKDKWSNSPAWSPSPKQDWSPSPVWSPSPKQEWSPSPSPYYSPSPEQKWSPSPSPVHSPSPPPNNNAASTGGAYHCTGCTQGDGKFFCQKCEYW
ncbi:probable LIM domain-binding protein 3 at C-terminar half [Coccomyxa sp. Obi]|nr:probable LIM domain-binding protein 3 at C-terminar half [Coccomyxa sp. Obi]